MDIESGRLQALLQEESELRNEIARIQESQRKMVFSSLASSGGILSFITVTTGIFKDDIQRIVDIAVPLTMGLSLIFTMIFVVYIGLYFGILRLSQYCFDVVYPNINKILCNEDNKVFQWEQHLRKDKRSKFLDWVTIALHAAGEAGSLFLLIIMYQAAWVFLLNYSGQSLLTGHWIFLGAETAVLAVILLLGIRVIALSSRSVKELEVITNKSISPAPKAADD
ncbi:hypothetical protein [Aliiglaciecola sp. M165]|uniref:hypothetical protein n=1 Tax=Aliiglaciecola sp. M165 TaxID=2593649 RepID=UPI00117C9585|nr:hypothetical protein [Aliiglaciecola sp. M165]TRY30329.1 hypothetical protein FM019_16085 [Aliiglaciecola sp. M165]